MNRIVLTSVMLMSLCSTVAFAERSQRPPQPPMEAFQACENKQENEATVIKTPYGDEIAATCKVVKHPDQGKLVAVPNEKPQPPQDHEEQ